MIATCGLVVVLLGACGSAAPSAEPTTVAADPSGEGATPEGAPAGAEDDVLDVVCLANGTSPDDHRVAAQADGVHFHILNASGRQLGFEMQGIGGDNAPETEGTLVWPVPPGIVGIRCRTFDPGDPPWVKVEVVDPAGFYVPDKVTCAGTVANGSFDFIEGAQGEAGDPVDLTRRRYPGIRAGDVVERAGYAVPGEQKVRVVRDGVVEIVATYQSDGAGGWLAVSDEVCQDDMLP